MCDLERKTRMFVFCPIGNYVEIKLKPFVTFEWLLDQCFTLEFTEVKRPALMF